jgi:hypothetical protein
MPLITFSAGTKAKAADVNANFALCLLKDAAAEITVASAVALAVGRQGVTNPALLVHTSTASSATGVQITAAAAGGGVAIAAISSGTNENLTIDAKGSGTITIGGTSTGAITISRDTTHGGFVQMSGNLLKFDQSATRSWTVQATGGNLAMASGDGAGAFTFNTTVTTVASSASRTGLNIPHGTAPSAPVNGDVWTTTSGLFVRVNGATVGPLT